MNTYNLSRLWFSFSFENSEVKPVHTALYFWILERGNASGWKKIIDIQTDKSMECLGITDWRTYKNALQFLVDHKFIIWVEKSKNQYTCNRVTIIEKEGEVSDSYKNAYANNAEANAEAVAEAIVEAYAEPHVEAIAEALQSYINLKTSKPLNQKPLNKGKQVADATPPVKVLPSENLKEKKATQTGAADYNLKSFTDAYYLFYESRVGIKPNFTAADGVAASNLRKYLKDASIDKTEEGALNSLNYIFKNWDCLEPFLQNQLDLKQITSNINNIMNQIKNGAAKKQSGSQNNGNRHNTEEAVAIARMLAAK